MGRHIIIYFTSGQIDRVLCVCCAGDLLATTAFLVFWLEPDDTLVLIVSERVGGCDHSADVAHTHAVTQS
jgi:hypothetical protein